MSRFNQRHHHKFKMATAFAIAGAVNFILNQDDPDAPTVEQKPYSELLREMQAGADTPLLHLNEPFIRTSQKDGTIEQTRVPDIEDALKEILSKNPDIDYTFDKLDTDEDPEILLYLLLFASSLYGLSKFKHAPRWASNALKHFKSEDDIAAHEAAHTLVAYRLGQIGPGDYVTLIGNDDSNNPYLGRKIKKQAFDRQDVEDNICISLAGAVADENKNGQHNTGSSGDMDMVSWKIRSLIIDSGLSETIPMGNQELVISNRSKNQLQKEIEDIIAHNLKRTREILVEDADAHTALTDALNKKKFLNAYQIAHVIEEASKNKPQMDFEFEAQRTII